MHAFLSTLVAFALVSSSRVDAGPCGYGALCGRSACDGPTVAAFKTALPELLACQAVFKDYRSPYPDLESEATLRKLCLAGACGTSLKTLVKFYDIQTNVCELNYPTRVIEVLSYGYGYVDLCLSDSASVKAYPALRAELSARIAEARGAAVATTAPPATTTPSPKPGTPAPTTSSPTPPPATVLPATSTPTTEASAETPTPTEAESSSNTTTGSNSSGSSGAVAQPQAADSVVGDNATTMTTAPTPSVPKTSATTSPVGMTSLLAMGTAATAVMLM